ncbi:MAG TPA: sodium:proton antiporter [Candidatus Limnocylindrales bacterium]|nr:sodium:proton antiporter [Candidatus Limnocylindrales bacterium]
MLGITSALALFTLLVVASAVFFAAKRLRIPYTVLLVLTGLLLVPLARVPLTAPVFGFLDDLVLTPELLFYIFLPVLIFESAYNMNIRRIVENAWSISLLAIVGLLISTALVAGALYFILPLIGLPIPFIVALLFGAIISSTDPVAVLALFKEYGAPKRLTMIFEGESLFNDGTAVALFLVVLAVAQEGFQGTSTIIDAISTFVLMVLAGGFLGLVLAMLFTRALRYTRSNEFVTVTLLIVSAHIIFILSELINQHGVFGVHIHVSPIIATTIGALFLGNYARHILSPRSDAYIAKSIEHLAFVANSLVFLLAGILFASSRIDFGTLWLPILISIIIVATARIVSVYAVLLPMNRLKVEAPIPGSWMKLLAWGSLRGALAIIVVLLIPEDFSVPGWNYAFSPQDFLLALTIGCILATLFVKALTIGVLIRKLEVDKPEPFEQARELDLATYVLMTERDRIKLHKERGFIRQGQYERSSSELDKKIATVRTRREELASVQGTQLFEQSLHLMALDIEERYLKDLYVNDEISEAGYRRISGKLNLQRDKIEHAEHHTIDPSLYKDRKDVFDILIGWAQQIFDRQPKQNTHFEEYQSYRAQAIIARKAIKTLNWMQQQYSQTVFLPEIHQRVILQYIDYQNEASKKMELLILKHGKALEDYTDELAERTVRAAGLKAAEYLEDKELVDEALMHSIEHRYLV